MVDVLVVGGGPAGVTAALRARELGASVALVESKRLGGTCTNDGCVPVRVLAKAARLVRDAADAGAYGVGVGVTTGGASATVTPPVDFAAVMRKVAAVVEQMHAKKRIGDHLRQCGVDVIDGAGDASFVDAHTLALPDGRTVRGRSVILAVGGRAATIPVPGGELATVPGPAFWAKRELPRRTVVIGASATGCQVASALAAFGSRVTVLEQGPRVMGAADTDVSAAIASGFARNGIDVATGCAKGITRIDRREGGTLAVTYDGGGGGDGNASRVVEADLVFSAVGWRGNADRLNLAASGIEVGKRGFVKVDAHQRTNVTHVYAVGDVGGQLLLVQTAYHEGTMAAENAVLGPHRTCERLVVPYGGFTDPEYGGVGLTETQARERGFDVVVARVSYETLDRAVIDGLPDGFCKLIADRTTHEVLGAHVAGEDAAEVVQIVAAAMTTGAKVGALAALQLSYPTFTAIVGIAARQLARDLGTIRSTEHLIPADWERGGG